MPIEKKITGTIDLNTLLAFGFGVGFLAIMLGFAVAFPNPTPFQIRVFMTALATSAAGVGAVLPGYLHVEYKNVFRAGGALGLFAVVWFFQPVIEKNAVTFETPEQSPDPVIATFFDALDRGEIMQVYDQIDPVLRESWGITAQRWEELYNANLRDLGPMVRRELMGVNALISPSGFPLGLYRYQNYLTKYKNIKGCRAESLMVRATQDKLWRVSSYQISPVTVDCPPKFLE